MRRLVLLRHGQTAWNAEHRIQGQVDSELDQVGLAQAAAVAPLVAALEPALLWTSDLARARRTAEIVGEVCGLTPVPDERLREYSLGRWQGTTHQEFAVADPAAFELFRTGRWDELADAEPPEAVAKRFAACLGDLVDALGPGELGVAVAHGASIRTGLVAWLGWEPAAASDFGALTNCARVELTEREDGGWAVSAYNITAP
ncbi:MAG TPA: histidine phosphatase family protein [Nocardioides sp.]|nr:histidine phosphatase family protein [Nocardioides sp.]